ncbi:hypothetical protein HYW87_02310 [Candidatus Roizmanbacteria bacterium]|nr:hypothetical protein [Candidatus Roizmanbacteria bacterium]
MKKTLLNLFVVSLLVFCVKFYVSPVQAQQVSLSLTATTIEVVAKPGSSCTLTFTLKNLADPTTIVLKVVNADQQGNRGILAPRRTLEGPIRFSLDDPELQLDEPFFFKNNEVKTATLTIDVAKQALLKDYSFLLLAESQPPPVSEAVSAVRLKSSIGSNIFISVSQSPLVKVDAKIALFDILTKFKLPFGTAKIAFIDSFDKVAGVLTVENRGDYRIFPRGKMQLRGGIWNKKNYDIEPQLVPAQSQRTLSVGVNSDPSASSSFTLSGFFLGVYDLTTTLNFGPGTPTLYGSTIFICFPFKALVFIGVIASLYFYLRRRKTVN